MTPRQARLGVDIFTGAVIASVALALASLTWRLAGYSGVAPAVAPALIGGGQQADIRPVLALAPFGSAVSAATPGSDGAVRLRAIFLAIPVEASTVLLAGAGADGKVTQYGLGQAVGGGVIEAIQAEQIVLRTPSGPRTIGFGPDGGTPVAPTPGSVANVPAPSAATGVSTAQPPSGIAEVRALIPAQMQGGNVPANVATAISAPPLTARVPVSSGYLVGASPGSAILAAGVRPGDVIERVNGVPVTAGTNERDLIAQATAAGSARLEILRGGRRVSLTVPVH
ncbi:MAG: signaling protein [Novosphingobium sp.]